MGGLTLMSYAYRDFPQSTAQLKERELRSGALNVGRFAIESFRY